MTSKFAENSDLTPKTKLGKLRKLSRDIRNARRAMYAAERKITCFAEEYNLDTKQQNAAEGCINKFGKVALDASVTAQFDDAGYHTFCPLFSTTDFCANNKCELHAANMDYVTAKDRYNVARLKRREFVKNMFRSK
ncbi:MAG: hypothetical protein J5742_00745 [Alphaproteobacteria bacterium]|nr:hypothetical protein [Alphaproteobacteria bacterium]